MLLMDILKWDGWNDKGHMENLQPQTSQTQWKAQT